MTLDNDKSFYYGLCCGLVLLLAFFPIVALAGGNVADWQLVTRRDGIKVLMAQKADADLKTFRGVTTIKLDDFTAIGAFMDDYDFVADWLHMVSGIDGIKRVGYNNRLVRVTTSLPWPVSDRDVILRVGMYQDPVTYAVHMPFHNVKDIYPKQDDYVRMPSFNGYFLFRPLQPGTVEVALQVVVNPGGYIPGWIANLLMRDIPFYSLEHLRQAANQPRFRHQHLDYYKVPPSWRAADKSKPLIGSATSK